MGIETYKVLEIEKVLIPLPNFDYVNNNNYLLVKVTPEGYEDPNATVLITYYKGGTRYFEMEGKTFTIADLPTKFIHALDYVSSVSDKVSATLMPLLKEYVTPMAAIYTMYLNLKPIFCIREVNR